MPNKSVDRLDRPVDKANKRECLAERTSTPKKRIATGMLLLTSPRTILT
jgi:hypothetical protein